MLYYSIKMTKKDHEYLHNYKIKFRELYPVLYYLIFSANCDNIGLEARSVAQFGRAAVSKTAGRGFESSHSCQREPRWRNPVDALA